MSYILDGFICTLQAAVCAVYAGLFIEFRKPAYRAAFPIICTALLSAAVMLLDNTVLIEGTGCITYPALMLVLSVTVHRKLTEKLVAGVVPLAIGTAVNTGALMIFHPQRESGLKQLIYNDRQLITLFVTVQLLWFVVFGMLVRMLRSRKTAVSYDSGVPLTVTGFSAAAGCIMLCLSVRDDGLRDIFGIAALLFALLCMLICYLSKLQSRRRELETELQNAQLREHYSRQYTESLMQQYGSVRRIKHDMHNNFLTLTELIAGGEYDRAYRFAKENTDALEAMQTFADTGSSVANAVINSKLSYAAELGISTKCLSVCNISGISDTDLCSLLGNALDNAMAACSKLPAGSPREISLEISCENERYYTFTVSNSIDGSVLDANPTLATDKPDKEDHGLGLKIISEITERHGGRVDLFEADGQFVCRIALIAEQTAVCDK